MREERKEKREKRVAPDYFLGNMVFVFLLIFFASCQDIKKPEKPQNLISKEKMTAILTDVYISNAARSINNKLLKEYHIKLDSLVYKKYQIDSLQFAESNAYYSSNLKVYTQIITSVEERLIVLQKEKDSIYELVKKEKGDTISGKDQVKKSLLESSLKSETNENLLNSL